MEISTMKKLFLVLAFLLPSLTACGASAPQLNNKGNEAFNQQNYDAALSAYQQAQGESPELAEPHYNAANTYYRQEHYDQAQAEIEQALVKDKTGLTENSFYNLGNSLFQQKQYEGAVNAYQEALRLKPDDLEAKQNLELALKQMQQEQQEQQQEQQQQDQSQQD